MSAFSYYLAQKYTESIRSARRFLSIHPGNTDAPYAQYLIALSYYEQITDVTRDQAITRRRSDAFGELVRRYPDTRYAADARLKVDLVRDHLAGKEMEIGRFYQRRGSGSPRPTASAPWSTNIRPPATRPKRLSGWSNAISRSAFPRRRARRRPCSAPIIRGTKWYQRPTALIRSMRRGSGRSHGTRPDRAEARLAAKLIPEACGGRDAASRMLRRSPSATSC